MDNLCTQCDYPLEPIDNGSCPLCGRYTMNEGDYHSGPEGYEPNTAYPDTFYGGGDYDYENESSYKYGDNRIVEYDDDEYR